MNVGRSKVKELGLSDKIKFKKEDCCSLTFQDNSFDAITVAFGIRNFENLDKGLEEMCRVLKSDGHLVSIKAFPQGEVMSKIIEKAGFKKVEFKRLTFGICTLYMASKQSK